MSIVGVGVRVGRYLGRGIFNSRLLVHDTYVSDRLLPQSSASVDFKNPADGATSYYFYTASYSTKIKF